MPRRVLFVLSELDYSGAETMLRACAEIWAEWGIEPHILSTGGGGIGRFAPILAGVGYRLHHIPFRRSPAFLARLAAFLIGRRFDVVHVQCEHANVWFALLALVSGARVLRTVHSVFAFSGGLRLRRLVQRRLLRLLGVPHIAISDAVAATEARCYGIDTVKVNSWIDAARFLPAGAEGRVAARARFGLADQDFALLLAGQCSPIKNHKAAIAALARLPADTILLHAGSGPLEAEERDLARTLGVEARLRFLGPVDDMPALLQAADVFLMPSLCEGLGLAAAEALAAAVPVVLADVPGLDSFRPYLGAGEWCAPDAASIADAVTRLRSRRGEALAAQAAAAAAALRADFDWRPCLEKLRPLYGVA